MNPVSPQTATLTQLIQPITQVASKILIIELILEKKKYISGPRGSKDVKTERNLFIKLSPGYTYLPVCFPDYQISKHQFC